MRSTSCRAGAESRRIGGCGRGPGLSTGTTLSRHIEEDRRGAATEQLDFGLGWLARTRRHRNGDSCQSECRYSGCGGASSSRPQGFDEVTVSTLSTNPSRWLPSGPSLSHRPQVVDSRHRRVDYVLNRQPEDSSGGVHVDDGGEHAAGRATRRGANTRRGPPSPTFHRADQYASQLLRQRLNSAAPSIGGR